VLAARRRLMGGWRAPPFGARLRALRRLLVTLLFVMAACSRKAPDATPEGALREWLDHMEASVDDPREAHAAYGLLGPQARKNLEDRAERASRVQGRRVDPEDMLATGRFGLRFRPQTMRATITGNDATVEVTGDDLADHAVVQCHKEGDAWRVEPALPDLLELPRRPDGGP